MTKQIRYPLKGIPISDLTLELICGRNEQDIVSYWVPRREEIERFVRVAKIVHTGEGKPVILEVGCGTAFLAYLLAETGEVDVIGMDPFLSFYGSPYSHPHLKLEEGNSKDAVKEYKRKVDVVLNSFMPNGINLTPDIYKIDAKAIIYARDSNKSGVSVQLYRQQNYFEGFDELFSNEEEHRKPEWVSPEIGMSFHSGTEYRKAFEWHGNNTHVVLEYLLRTDPEYSRPSFVRNIIQIQIRKDVASFPTPEISVANSAKYLWEFQMEQLIGRLESMSRYFRFY